MINMDKALLFLTLVLTFCACLTLFSVECRHHNPKSSEKGRPGDESFEEYLKDAIDRLKLADSTQSGDTDKNARPHLSDKINDEPKATSAYSDIKSTTGDEKYHSKMIPATKRKHNGHVRNVGYGPPQKQRKTAPWYKRTELGHKKLTEHKTSRLPKENNGAILNSLKPFIRREVIRDFVLVRHIEAKLAKYNQDMDNERTGDVAGDVKKLRHRKTIVLNDGSSTSLLDGKNLLLFGIGVGSTVLIFILGILGFHCFRCLRYKDGLFVKNIKKENSEIPTTCTNNNSHHWERDFLTKQRKADEFSSSSEEVFNVSIPRLSQDSLPNSPIIQRSSTAQSTPIKTRKTPLR